jgi:hypothetical protein
MSVVSAQAEGGSSKNVCKGRKRIVCADLKLQEPMRGEDQLHPPNMQRAQARTSSGTSAPSFASSKPRGLANGHPYPNRKRNAGDARR